MKALSLLRNCRSCKVQPVSHYDCFRKFSFGQNIRDEENMMKISERPKLHPDDYHIEQHPMQLV